MEKPLQITFKNLDSSEYLERLIRERVAHLERLQPRLTGCHVIVRVPHRGAESAKNPLGITIEVEVPGHKKIVAKDQEERREAKNDQAMVVNRAFDSVLRQLESLSDIRTGEVKRHDTAGETGQIVRLFPEQDYGFVEIADASDLYFTRNAVIGGSFDELQVGTLVQVTRATTEGPMGPQASSIRVLGGNRSAS